MQMTGKGIRRPSAVPANSRFRPQFVRMMPSEAPNTRFELRRDTTRVVGQQEVAASPCPNVAKGNWTQRLWRPPPL
jgi:hypothetical protein